jgi:hypothetical protein
MAGSQAVATGHSSSFAFTASDTVDEPAGICNAFLCTVAGNATILLESSTATFASAYLAGVVYPLRVRRLNAGALTATLIGLKA